jgi:hypothetical protein
MDGRHGFTYLVAAAIYAIVTVAERARSFNTNPQIE